MLYVTYDDEYVIVSGVDGQSKPFLIGPVHDQFADTAVGSTVRMLEALGHPVLTADTAPAELVAGQITTSFG